MIKGLVIVPIFAAILFVLELSLSFLPNIQLTFLLLALYTKVFGFRKTFFIIVIHVLLDNLVMGSFNIFVIAPMFFGYVIYCGLVFLIKTNNEIILAFVAVLGSIIYALLFLPFSAFVFDVDILDYLKADILFTIILVSSSFISVLLLYKPLYRVLDERYRYYIAKPE